MKVEYNKPADVLTIIIRDAKIVKSAEVRFGVGADYGADGQVVKFKIRNASEHIMNLNQCENNPRMTINQALDHIAGAISYNGAQPIP